MLERNSAPFENGDDPEGFTPEAWREVIIDVALLHGRQPFDPDKEIPWEGAACAFRIPQIHDVRYTEYPDNFEGFVWGLSLTARRACVAGYGQLIEECFSRTTEEHFNSFIELLLDFSDLSKTIPGAVVAEYISSPAITQNIRRELGFLALTQDGTIDNGLTIEQWQRMSDHNEYPDMWTFYLIWLNQRHRGIEVFEYAQSALDLYDPEVVFQLEHIFVIAAAEVLLEGEHGATQLSNMLEANSRIKEILIDGCESYSFEHASTRVAKFLE